LFIDLLCDSAGSDGGSSLMLQGRARQLLSLSWPVHQEAASQRQMLGSSPSPHTTLQRRRGSLVLRSVLPSHVELCSAAALGSYHAAGVRMWEPARDTYARLGQWQDRQWKLVHWPALWQCWINKFCECESPPEIPMVS
jgi:hypothetical protein